MQTLSFLLETCGTRFHASAYTPSETAGLGDLTDFGSDLPGLREKNPGRGVHTIVEGPCLHPAEAISPRSV